MSKSNGMAKNNENYLQHVSLKNYKSIKNVEIDFKPGLNIIIGKNASGKTNFINGLNKVLDYEYNEILASEFAISAYFKKDYVTIKKSDIPTALDFVNSNHHSLLKKIDVVIEVNGNPIIDSTTNFNKYYPPIYALSDRGLYFDTVLIKYGISYDSTSQFISLPFSFEVLDKGTVSQSLIFFIMAGNHSKLTSSFFDGLYKFLSEIDRDNPDLLTQFPELKNRIVLFSEKYFEKINPIISRYSPIKEIRLNGDFTIITAEENLKQTINNFYIEFLIDQSWVPFAMLSDGTKRLFYVISEILASYNSRNSQFDDLNIVLLEEPELGIHPHQLHLLMQFIKEQSRYKQIIITTHSPQVLDVLEPDELDRIIICHYDTQNKTQLNHLSDKEASKAKKYMESEAFLSDYWRFSDLEPA
jgi:predicted ATPase